MFKFSNTVYDWIKWLCILLLPYGADFYEKLAEIWGLPYGVEIPSTMRYAGIFLAGIFAISTAQYYQSLSESRRAFDTVSDYNKPTPPNTPTTPTEPTEEPKVEEPKDNGSQGIGGTCICEKGKSYYLTCNVKVRESYGTDARWLKRDELTEDGKAHSLDGEYAVLAQGTEVYCQEQPYFNWIKIPSGWICARDMDGTDNVAAQSRWQFPVNYVGISGGYNSAHLAYDFGFSDNPNQPIFAPCNCTVSACGWNDVVGNYVFANFNYNGQDYTWRFIHMSEYSVSVGQSLSQGQQIGLMGATGSSSTGNYHLHMDLWRGTYSGSMPSDRAGASVDYLSLLYLYPHQSVGDVTDSKYHINRA